MLQLFSSQTSAPAASAGFALCQRGHAFGQGLHHTMAFKGRHGQPLRDFHARASAADAEAGLRLDNADLYTGGFNLGTGRAIHDANVGCLSGHAMAPSDLTCQSSVNS